MVTYERRARGASVERVRACSLECSTVGKGGGGGGGAPPPPPPTPDPSAPAGPRAYTYSTATNAPRVATIAQPRTRAGPCHRHVTIGLGAALLASVTAKVKRPNGWELALPGHFPLLRGPPWALIQGPLRYRRTSMLLAALGCSAGGKGRVGPLVAALGQ